MSTTTYEFRVLPVIETENLALSKARAKVAKWLADKSAVLVEKQNALNTSITEMTDKPLTEILDWPDVSKTYASLLLDELSLRLDYADFEKGSPSDSRAYNLQLETNWQKTRAEVLASLVSIGYSEEVLVGSDVIGRHPSVKAAFLAVQFSPRYDNSKELANAQAIASVQAELQGMRNAKKI